MIVGNVSKLDDCNALIQLGNFRYLDSLCKHYQVPVYHLGKHW